MFRKLPSSTENAADKPITALRLLFVAAALATSLLAACGGGGDDEPATPPPEQVDKYSQIPTPTVTGPIASESFFSPTNNYTFYSTDVSMQAAGYVEEEFFFEGKANAYDAPNNAPATPPTANANIVTEGVPYKTRFVVRRPTDPAKFNGTVVIEWLNVTDNFDGEYFWVNAKDYLLRAGYAYIGVSAQNNGISNATLGLKTFSPTRYASLDVTGGGTVTQDKLSYDIFSQTAKAARAVPQVLNGLPVKNVMAIGMSQSGSRMGVYTNYIHLRAPIYDSFLIQVATPAVRDDLNAPLIKVLSESEGGSANALNNSQPDTATRKTYWIAGTNHGDETQRLGRTGVRLRDLGPQNTTNDSCGPDGSTATRSRTPFRHVLNAAVSHLKRQVETGVQAPSGAQFTKTAATPTAIERDANGNALGAIRLAHMDVPTARANGSECGNIGAWVPFATAQLQTLYPTHQDYVAKVKAAVDASVAAGFVLPEDGATTLAEAEASVIGTGLECGLLCLSRSHFTADFSSTGLLRDNTVYYNTKDGAPLLQAVDEAHYWTASGYSTTGAAARYNFGFAIAALQRYIELVQQAQIDGRMTGTAATTLTTQANTIIKALQPLAAV